MNTFVHEPVMLDWDLSELGDEEFFSYLVEFPGSKNIVRLASKSNYQLPTNITFTGNLYKVKKLDFLYNSVHWPIMSPRMLSALKSIGDFPCREIPITILDDTVPSSKLFNKLGVPNKEYALEHYTAIQLISYLDAFDWERSVYQRSKYVPTLAGQITKLVLKAVPGGFPPIFRISACPTLLFISSEARIALEKIGITGVAYKAISEYP